MGRVLYFAYGSNLDDDQMRSRCPSARAVGRAVLANYALAFGGFSHRWGGAVASVLRAPGARVEGFLYRIDAGDLRSLDRFEGHPFANERVMKLVVDEEGQRRRAAIYIQPEVGFEPWTPAVGYFAVLWREYTRLGFDGAALAAAAGGGTVNEYRGSRAQKTRVFVYGTLLRGESNHRLLARARWVGDGRTAPQYELHDLGAFPGLVARGSQSVVGEVYEVDHATLAALDRLEGHPEFYRRTAITLSDGSHVETYLLTPEQVQGRKVIHSGDWRARRQEQRA